MSSLCTGTTSSFHYDTHQQKAKAQMYEEEEEKDHFHHQDSYIKNDVNQSESDSSSSSSLTRQLIRVLALHIADTEFDEPVDGIISATDGLQAIVSISRVNSITKRVIRAIRWLITRDMTLTLEEEEEREREEALASETFIHTRPVHGTRCTTGLALAAALHLLRHHPNVKISPHVREVCVQYTDRRTVTHTVVSAALHACTTLDRTKHRGHEPTRFISRMLHRAERYWSKEEDIEEHDTCEEQNRMIRILWQEIRKRMPGATDTEEPSHDAADVIMSSQARVSLFWPGPSAFSWPEENIPASAYTKIGYPPQSIASPLLMCLYHETPYTPTFTQLVTHFGCDPNQMDDQGFSPLHHLVMLQRFDIIPNFLALDQVNVNKRTENSASETALHQCARLSSSPHQLHYSYVNASEIFLLLLHTGRADITLRNGNGERPLDVLLRTKAYLTHSTGRYPRATPLIPIVSFIIQCLSHAPSGKQDTKVAKLSNDIALALNQEANDPHGRYAGLDQPVLLCHLYQQWLTFLVKSGHLRTGLASRELETCVLRSLEPRIIKKLDAFLIPDLRDIVCEYLFEHPPIQRKQRTNGGDS